MNKLGKIGYIKIVQGGVTSSYSKIYYELREDMLFRKHDNKLILIKDK